jgi:ubiquinone/menaquinone biosynthesis C-methylase UbiE
MRGAVPGSSEGASVDVPAYATYLDRVARFSGDARRVRYEFLRLERGHRVLDAGCGVGEVARAFAALVGPHGRAVGIDLSARHVALARERSVGVANLEFRVGDLRALPFDSATFHAAYSERVFQHLRDPGVVMAELFRVLRPGGRLVTADADHTRTATDADDSELADKVQAAINRSGPVNPAAGRRLRSQMLEAGFVDVAIVPEPLVMTDFDLWQSIVPNRLEDVLDDLVADGDITRRQAESHLADLARRNADGRFLCVLPGYTVVGVKPPTP